MRKGRKPDIVLHIIRNTQEELNQAILLNEETLFSLLVAQAHVAEVALEQVVNRHIKRVQQHINLKNGIRKGKKKVKTHGSK
jgi:hypothetical protein